MRRRGLRPWLLRFRGELCQGGASIRTRLDRVERRSHALFGGRAANRRIRRAGMVRVERERLDGIVRAGAGPESSQEPGGGCLHLREGDAGWNALRLVVADFQGLQALFGHQRCQRDKVVDQVLRVAGISMAVSKSLRDLRKDGNLRIP